MMAKAGISHQQGFYFGRPLLASQFASEAVAAS
jgi:hypothetical protein